VRASLEPPRLIVEPFQRGELLAAAKLRLLHRKFHQG